MSGVDAAVRIAVEQHALDAQQGLRTAALFSGYPGSPLGGIDLLLERENSLRDAPFLVHVPAVNEELGGAAVWGSQLAGLTDRSRYDGVVGFWYGKSPGLDRSGDLFRHANTMGVAANGGVVAIVGDDPTAKSSTMPNDSQPVLANLNCPVLAPHSVGGVLELGLHAVALSRFCGLWTAVKIVTDLADGFAATRVDEHIPTVVLPQMTFEGQAWTYRQALSMNNVIGAYEEGEIFYHRLEAARAYGRANNLNRLVHAAPAAKVGVVLVGRAIANGRQAFAQLGLDDESWAGAPLRLLEVQMPFPIHPDTIREFAAGLDNVLVIEEKRPFVETAIRDALYGGPDQPRVIGKRDDGGRAAFPADGELTPDRIAGVVFKRLRPMLPADTLREPRRHLTLDVVAATPAPRVPAYCSGCPHNRSTSSVPGTVVGGGVGCHSIVYLEDRHLDDTILPLTPMGSEGALWLGASPFSSTTHMIQNLGDGTLSHSGSLAVRACVAGGVNITFKILFNAAVAMTGGQDVAGQRSVPDLTRELEAMGVARTIVCADDPKKYGSRARWAGGVTVRSRDDLRPVEAELATTAGVTVLIYDQRCAAEARRLWRRGKLAEPATRVVINQAVCEGCGDCQRKSNCLSVRPIDTALGRKTQIHQSSCNHDLSCLDGDCPSFVTVRTDVARTAPAAPTPPELPEPELHPVGDTFSVYMVGIGGTGVVTGNRLLATVAARTGWSVAGLDQTGLSQKAGAVSSHLRLSRVGEPSTNLVGDGACDVFFAFDTLSAVQPKHLQRIAKDRTAAVVVEGLVPTASMIAGLGDVEPDAVQFAERVGLAARHSISTDANGVCEDLFGDDVVANVFTIGVAFQAGLLPFTAADFVDAVRESIPNPERTLTAFGWGRASVARPELLDAVRPVGSGQQGLRVPTAAAQRRGADLIDAAVLPETTRQAARWRAQDLVDYQSAGLAARYVDAVVRAASAETQAGCGNTEFSEAVVFGYYKLLAYKDEYEVARLHLDPGFRELLTRQVGTGKRKVMLHPPTLRALGMRKKIAFGQPIQPVFKALHAARRLRGTRLDPFGYAEVRRVERQLISEYERWLAETITALNPANAALATQLMRLPDKVRGFEQIKLRSVTEYRAAAAELQTAIRTMEPAT